MKKRIRDNRFIFNSTLTSYVLLLILISFLPLEFSGYRNSDSLAPMWYFITETGGLYGSALILVTFITYLYFHFRSSGKKMKYLIELIVLIVVVEISSLAFSQLYTKEIVREPRPSQMYLVEKGVIENGGREYFSMPMKEKENYLKQRTEDRKSDLEDVYPPILSSWSYDTSFSFPSGHSQSSYFLGVMISFVMYRVLSGRKKFLCLIPLVWALLVSLSRVIIGVHYPRDVAAGAAVGILFAFLLIMLKITDRALKLPSAKI